MDSLELYYHFQQNYLNDKTVDDTLKLNDVDVLIGQICSEIFGAEPALEGSPFLCEVMYRVRQADAGDKVSKNKAFIVDAYIIVQGVAEYIKDQRFTAEKYFSGYEKYLFSESMPRGNQAKRMQKIKEVLERLTVEINGEKCSFTPKKKTASGMDEKRREQNRVHVQLWHDEQARISEKLMEMQPALGQLIKGFMNFSDTITEQYVLQFAKMQAELFDLIWDACLYHKKKAESSGSRDYMNAVLNYEEYMFSIVDSLAAFGIEEICSSPGTAFDGMIHEPDSGSFSTKTALVGESVRSGFRYKDIIIQKEKIKIGKLAD